MNIANRLIRIVGHSAERCPGKWRSLDRAVTKIQRRTHVGVTYTYDGPPSYERSVALDMDIFRGRYTNTDLNPIVVLPGLFSHKGEWKDVCAKLNNDTLHKVVCFDTVNHGRSTHHHDMSYKAQACDIDASLLNINIKKRPICVGHRMGGKTAAALALGEPWEMFKLVLIDSAPSIRQECQLGNITAVLKEAVQIDMACYKNKDDIYAELQSIPHIEPLLLELLFNNVVPNYDDDFNQVGFKSMCNLHNVMNNYEQIIHFYPFVKHRKYEGPTLFIGESQDNDAIKARFPNVEIHNVEDIDFNIQKNMPNDMIDVISDFVKMEHGFKHHRPKRQRAEVQDDV